MMVYAENDYDLLDGLQDLCLIALGIGGVIALPAEMSILGFIGIVSGVLGAVDGTINIYDYVTTNADGTYTISDEFVQAVVDAAEQLEAQGFTDSHVTAQGKGDLYTYRWTVTQSYMYNHPYKNTPESHHNTYTYSAENSVRVAGLKSVQTGTDSSGRAYTALYWYVYRYDRSYTNLLQSGRGECISSVDGKVSVNKNTSTSGFNQLTLHDGSEKSDRYSGSQSFGGNFPIFSSDDALKTYLKTGTGYKDAENYRATPVFRRHSSYTPVYSGGSVTVSRTVIENITQKITEVDADDSMTDDQKIEKLQEYIRTGETGSTGGDGNAGSGNTDYEDNKDQPPGTDLADSNSWLKKIYLKLCQIYDRINSAVEDVEQTALAKIQESLDEIIVQLKKIKHWTAVDTVIDGVDAIGDWLDLIHDVISDADEGAESAVSSISSALGDAAGLATKKFPFSIPWDLFFLISFFSAEPEVPHFEIPFCVPYYGLEYTFVIDFMDYQWLSDLIRPILLMIYATGLLSKTPSILSISKEE